MTKPSFLVIGGGVIGAASALRLSEAGHKVTLLDRRDFKRAASYGNAGHLAAEQTEPLASLHNLMTFPARLFAFGGPLDLRVRDAAHWAPWAVRFARACTSQQSAAGAKALGDLTSRAIEAWRELLAPLNATSLLRESGHVVLWMDATKAAKGMRAWGRADIGAASFTQLSKEERDAYRAVLRAPPAAGIRFSGTGQVTDPQALCEALLAAFTGRGGEIVRGEARSLSCTADCAKVTLTSGDVLSAQNALVAAGVWSRELMATLGVNAPLIAEHGYHIQSRKHDWPAALPTTVFEEHSIVVSHFTSGLRATSFVELGAPDARPDARKWRMLQRHLTALGITFSAQPDLWAGPRPTLPDYLPAIGRLKDRPNLFYAFGHQHLGLTLAAISAALITDLAEERTSPLDLMPYRIERFT